MSAMGSLAWRMIVPVGEQEGDIVSSEVSLRLLPGVSLRAMFGRPFRPRWVHPVLRKPFLHACKMQSEAHFGLYTLVKCDRRLILDFTRL